jgi:hypothetical protein
MLHYNGVGRHSSTAARKPPVVLGPDEMARVTAANKAKFLG